MKLNLGCGENRLEGWENHDADTDITKPLPWPAASADAVFAEHVVEHVTPQQAWNFFAECLRVLRPGGAIRIAVPAVDRIENFSTPDYERFCFERGFSEAPTRAAAVKAIVFGHGHQSTWSAPVLLSFLRAVGFADVKRVRIWESHHGMAEANGHGKVIGHAFNELETIVAEGARP